MMSFCPFFLRRRERRLGTSPFSLTQLLPPSPSPPEEEGVGTSTRFVPREASFGAGFES
ncbi:hypothetical protein RchiOBHm_Chr5g0034701 [Rosa chinensis]|uniref:Uncharacterized protein n=1 Tax=Rosa chinensis TaxID=74649 RepID=A0A2P6QB14_ROSCH|nr:hypothetical protein RchiOBHm_Chr5g0034701 [Rosa chinensis]